jgi:hypothetical protein
MSEEQNPSQPNPQPSSQPNRPQNFTQPSTTTPSQQQPQFQNTETPQPIIQQYLNAEQIYQQPTQQIYTEKSKSKFKFIVIPIAIFILIASVIAGYFLFFAESSSGLNYKELTTYVSEDGYSILLPTGYNIESNGGTTIIGDPSEAGTDITTRSFLVEIIKRTPEESVPCEATNLERLGPIDCVLYERELQDKKIIKEIESNNNKFVDGYYYGFTTLLEGSASSLNHINFATHPPISTLYKATRNSTDTDVVFSEEVFFVGGQGQSANLKLIIGSDIPSDFGYDSTKTIQSFKFE